MATLLSTFYDALMGPLEGAGMQEIRKQLIHQATGDVLEIGSGTGLNFPHYQNAEKVIAVEPDSKMREKSMQRVKRASVPVEVVPIGAEALPFPDGTFDTVVGTLVLCTIPYPEQALEEIRRVCKPGGRVLFFEHVRLDHPILGRLQDGLTPVWKRLCDGCHLNRNTLQLVQNSGLEIGHVRRYYKDIFLWIEATNQ